MRLEEGWFFRNAGEVCGFFFQAVGGIRDAQVSRGLGDVYKRQVTGTIGVTAALAPALWMNLFTQDTAVRAFGASYPVSYTHLTLPTIYSV